MRTILFTIFCCLFVFNGLLWGAAMYQHGLWSMIFTFFFMPIFVSGTWLIAYRVYRRFKTLARFLRQACYGQAMGIAAGIFTLVSTGPIPPEKPTGPHMERREIKAENR